MAYEMKEGDISVFRNKNKEGATYPDFTGKCMVNGQIFYVSLWVKQLEGGTDAFLAGKISPPKDRTEAPREVVDSITTPTPVKDAEPVQEPLKDDLPF